MSRLSSPSAPDGAIRRFGMSARRWLSTFTGAQAQIQESDAFLFGSGATSIASLLGTSGRQVRTRQAIYDKWAQMEGSPIVSTALMLLVTSALGGHETSGELVFIEKTTEAKKNKQSGRIAEEMAADLAPLFNRIAFQCAYTASVFGDAYARLYTQPRTGVVDVYIDEMVRPPLVQPFERGGRTIGFAVYSSKQFFQKLDASQMARLKMPRTQWVPQHGVVEKSLRMALQEDELDQLPILPSSAGGSLLFNAEEAYDNLSASLLGLVGQRWLDSIDEQMLTVNMSSMTSEQQERFLASVVGMLEVSRKHAQQAVSSGRPIMERIRHIIPIFNDKQVVQLGSGTGQGGRAASITIEDVLLHARLLSGALGVDLSMLGFADQLSGGLGEGGFFRVSAQAAERARIIRVALADFFNQICDIHTLHRYGVVFEPQQRPWLINFYGSISALEAEKQRTRADAMNAGLQLVQSLQMLKDLGASPIVVAEFLEKQMFLDAQQAKMFASMTGNPPESDEEEQDSHTDQLQE